MWSVPKTNSETFSERVHVWQAHSSVERACLLGPVHCHKVVSDDRNSMRGDALRQAIDEDKVKGLIPFIVS